MSSRRVFAIIPAAGRSKRMGRPKQLLPYGEGTLLDAVVDAVLESPVDALVLVTNTTVARRYEENPEEDLLIEINADADSAMIDSIRLGLRRLIDEYKPGDDEGVLILPGDQPEIRAGVITTCAEAFRLPRHPPGILIAGYGGRRGHPAVFRFGLLREIEIWPRDRGLNELARMHPDEVRELPITSAPMPIDVNTPEDYERLPEPNG